MKISGRALARHLGINHAEVNIEIKKGHRGRLAGALDGNGKLHDLALAATTWRATRRPRADDQRPAKEPGDGQPRSRPAASLEPDGPQAPDYLEARARRELALAQLAELELGERSGQLGSVKEMRAAVEKVYHQTRNKLLGAPSKFRQRCPHVAVADILVLDNIVREALEALADGREPWADPE
jgi:hypothetical protein